MKATLKKTAAAGIVTTLITETINSAFRFSNQEVLCNILVYLQHTLVSALAGDFKGKSRVIL